MLPDAIGRGAPGPPGEQTGAMPTSSPPAAPAVSRAGDCDSVDVAIGRLAVDAVIVAADAALSVVDAHFRRDGTLRCVVVDAHDGPVLVERSWFESLMTGRMGFGRVLHSRRRIGELSPDGSMVFTADTLVSAVAAALISSSTTATVLDCVAVVWPGGRVGVVEVADVFESLALHYAHQSLHDPLTGLANRSQLAERVRTARDAATLFYIDLDRFKDVNDQLGHLAGDQVLTQFASRLLSVARSGDLVVRLGGDEFAVFADGIMTTADRRSVAERIVEQAAAPFRVVAPDGHGVEHAQSVTVGASVGVARAERSAAEATTSRLDLLLKQADLAMYRAKSHGRGRHVHFDPELAEDASTRAVTRARRTIERRLRHAIDRRLLDVHYQPVVELPSGRVIGAEALVRWRDAELGTVPPDEFIPVAESTGLVLGLGRWVLNAACREAARWRSAAGTPEPTVAVNVSPVQLAERTFVGDVTSALAASGLPPHRLHLEITETAAIADLAQTAELLASLRALGVRLVLDDFGTGHSSLTMLRTLPLTKVKVDRSFVEHVAERAGDAVLVRLVIDAAHSLGLTVCAEGIERIEQAQQLIAMGCDEAQGWLFGRPEPASAHLREVLGNHGSTSGDRLDAGHAPSLPLGGSDELVLITTPDRTVTYASSASGPLLGWLPREMLGTSVAEHLPGVDTKATANADADEQLAGSGADGTTVHRARHRDGSLRWLSSTTQWLFDHRGEPVEVLSVSRDVTAAVEAQVALRESEARFRHAFDDAPTGMAITRLDGSFVRVNTAFAALVGATPDELMARTVADLTHPADREADDRNVAALRSGAATTQDVLKRYLHVDGHAVAARVHAAVLGDRDGVPTFVVAHVIAT